MYIYMRWVWQYIHAYAANGKYVSGWTSLFWEDSSLIHGATSGNILLNGTLGQERNFIAWYSN